MFVVRAQGVRCRACLRLKLRDGCGSRTIGVIFLVEVGQDVSRFREHQIIVFEDWNVVLAGDIEDFCAHPPHIRDDDIGIGELQVSQFLSDDMTVRTPIDMEERQRHGDIRLPGNSRK